MQGVSLRQLELTDLPFIFATYLKSYKLAPVNRRIRDTIYYPAQHALLERCLARPSTKVVIACLTDEPSTILGYAIREYERAIIHYIYVKHEFQGYGIARMLISPDKRDPVDYTFTHWTEAVHNPRDGTGLLTSFPGLVYDPYRFLNG